MKRKRLLLLFFFLAVAAGCVSLPVEEEQLSTVAYPEPDRAGVYHKVKKSETLWRIAKVYEVPIEDIIRSNSIPDVAQLEENQLVFVPGAHAVRDIAVEVDDKDDNFIWPVKGDVISYYHALDGALLNKGINIRTQKGAVVKAARSGQVVFADDLTGYGKTVILKHAGGFHSIYAQNAEILVKLGDQVAKSTPVSRVGRGNETAYLHFEIRKDAIESNPLHYLP